jgi:hypothetical protein
MTGTVVEDGGPSRQWRQQVTQEKVDSNHEGEANKPPDDKRPQEGAVDGPGKSGTGSDDLGEASQDEPGNQNA